MLNFENPLDDEIKNRNKKLNADLPGITDHLFIVSPTKSGKSFLIKSMLAKIYNQSFNEIIIFNPTCMKENYKTIFNLPDESIIEDFDEEYLIERFNRQKEFFLESKGKYLTLFLFDDCSNQLASFDFCRKFIATARQYGITIWVSTQFPRDLKPAIRANFICYIVFPYISDENIKAISEITSISKNNFKELIKFIKDVNIENDTKYGFLYWNKTYPNKKFYGLVDLNHNLILDEIED